VRSWIDGKIRAAARPADVTPAGFERKGAADMVDEIFADGLGEITITGSTVRLDLVSFSTDERNADGEPKLVFKQRIILPVDGFMNAFDLMQKVTKELIGNGAVKRVGANEPTAQGPVANRSPSPNFQ
jgi:hypothetical protein